MIGPRRQVRAFGLIFAATASIIVSATAVVNYLMDPYGVFGTFTVAGINELKPRPEVMRSDIKFIVGMRGQPDALVLGNSRAEVGFDPGHSVFTSRGLHGYNAAIPGMGLDYSVDALALFTSAAHIQVAVVGIDFLDFLYAPDAKPDAASPPRIAASIPWARTRLLALFSTTAFFDSVRTLLIQRQRDPAIALSNGFNPMLDYREIAANEGYPALFRQRAQETARNLAKQPHNLYVGGVRASPSFEALRALLRIARDNDTEVHLVIYPYHLLLLMQFDEAGLWPLFEQWKSDVAIISDDARQGGVRVSLTDFGCPHVLTAEPVPADGDRKATMQWYWEAGHFKSALGDRVLSNIFAADQPQALDGFGLRVTSANIGDRNEACRGALTMMRQRFPALLHQAIELSK